MIAVNKEQPKAVTIQGKPVRPISSTESTRYLGIYLSPAGINKPILAKVEEEIEYITNRIGRKSITDKQAHYLIHNVLFPIIEYRTQVTFISKDKCHKWNRKVHTAFRKKANLPSDMPINTLQHPHLYNIKAVEDLQAESKITSLQIRLNTTGEPRQMLIQQILESQIKIWTPDNPISSPRFNLPDRHNSIIAGVSTILRERNIQIEIPDYPIKSQKKRKWIANYLPTEDYRKMVKYLRAKKLLFCDQVRQHTPPAKYSDNFQILKTVSLDGPESTKKANSYRGAAKMKVTGQTVNVYTDGSTDQTPGQSRRCGIGIVCLD
ncbi:MAG TPA: hypothetical protein VIY29_25225 [Ktedonobacteraceae bacterium]